MKVALSKGQKSGFSLLLVILLLGVGFLIMTGALRWGGASATLAGRFNEYYSSLAAAEAATEKVVGHISHHFQNSGVAGVDSQLINLRSLYPTAVEMPEWAQYEFLDPEGAGNTYVVKLSNEQYTTGLNWKYSGFGGYAASYRVVSNARRLTSPNNVVGIRQDVQVASLPLFEFAMFYAVDMELHPFTSDFLIGGRVHCNGNIYCEPHSPRSVTFQDHVTAAGKIVHDNHPLDPTTNRVFGSVSYLGERDTGVNALNLPIGTTNTPQALHGIIEIPPQAESPTSLMGQQRYYNKANLIIKITNTNAVAINGVTGLPVLWSVVAKFVSTNKTFYDARWQKHVRLTEIDVEDLRNSGNYQDVRDQLAGQDPKIIYVADLRTPTSQTNYAVRIIRSRNLPAPGLTLATMNPLYIKGHFNAPDTGTTNTSSARPASLVCDALTILSDNWDDNHSTDPLGDGRTNPNDTTINAAVIAGSIPSDGANYSGGVECYFRLLQDWYSGAKTLTFNGSIVMLYHSQIATAPWGGNDVYWPPIRKYSFDANFRDPLKLPPGTPRLRTLIRSEWTAARANSTL